MILFFQIEEFFVEGIDLGEEPFFDLVFVQDDAEICKWRIIIRFSKDIILIHKSRFIQLACRANAIMVRIERLDDEIGAVVLGECVVQEVEILFR